MTTRTRSADEDPAALWNGPAGRAWVDAQELLDRTFEPLLPRLVGAVSAGPGGRVLDVGCGTGSTTIAVARRLGAGSRAVGIDISEPMIAAARVRAERENAPADFICDDAQRHAFTPASFDTILSRFGVMFFPDPVQAFATLRRAAADGSRLRVIVWRSPAENPFMTTAERAAAPLLPALAPRRPDAPGQFAFADPRRVRDILESSGWGGVDIQALDVACTFPEKDLVRYLTRLGPVGRALDGADDDTRARVIEVVRPAFDAYVQGADVRFTAACWSVDAYAG